MGPKQSDILGVSRRRTPRPSGSSAGGIKRTVHRMSYLSVAADTRCHGTLPVKRHTQQPVMPNQSATESANDTRAKATRKAHRKVKSGCTACKARRQKVVDIKIVLTPPIQVRRLTEPQCDEQRPKCAGCIRHSTDCIYVTSSGVIQRGCSNILSPVTSVEHRTRLPTPRSNPSVSPSRDLNFEDLELLHQYITSTCVAPAQVSERTAQMQVTVPPLAQTHPFLMRGILAQAAVHLSWLRPSHKAHYTMLAAKHHSNAIPEFRSALQNINENNCRALILYSKGLVWCSFAWLETLSSETQAGSPKQKSDWLPHWFHLLRNSCLLVNHCAPWATTGFHILPRLEDTTEFAHSLDNHRLSALTGALLPLIESPIVETLLVDLKESFARASMRHHNTPLRNAIDFWVGTLTIEYMDALHRAEPWALVVMAHFSILIFRSETRWFMRGHAAELLHLLAERMPDTWEQYIQWPREEVGV